MDLNGIKPSRQIFELQCNEAIREELAPPH